jgi:hypothetical protein
MQNPDSEGGAATKIMLKKLPLSTRRPSLPYNHLLQKQPVFRLRTGWFVFFVGSSRIAGAKNMDPLNPRLHRLADGCSFFWPRA